MVKRCKFMMIIDNYLTFYTHNLKNIVSFYSNYCMNFTHFNSIFIKRKFNFCMNYSFMKMFKAYFRKFGKFFTKRKKLEMLTKLINQVTII
jgi:hypothetical protein